MCSEWISEQTAIISLYSFNRLVFITQTVCVYCAVPAYYLSFRLILVCKISMPSNTTDARVRSRTNPCEICGRQSGSGTVLSPSTSVFPVSTSAPTLSTRLSLGNCQKATFFQMLGNTGEKVLSLSSERVYYTHSHVRRVSGWCGTAVSFSLLSSMKCTGHVDRQTATATAPLCYSQHGVCICCDLVPNMTTADVMLDIFHCTLSRRLKPV